MASKGNSAATYTTAEIRNIALLGHAGSGKTSLVEKLLEVSGAITQAGRIDKGGTTSDWHDAEKKHGHSFFNSIVSLEHEGVHINLIDTPGLGDFTGRALSSLMAVETAAIVINADRGIETMTRRYMEAAANQNVCRMIIINRIDVAPDKLESLLAEIQSEFGSECLALNLPAADGENVADCYFDPQGEAAFSSVDAAHEQIVDQTVEVDEELMAKYLDSGSVEISELHDAFEQAMREGHLIPICFVSAESGRGVRQLKRIFASLMPSPLEGNPPTFIDDEAKDGEEKSKSPTPDPNAHAVAHVFQIGFDPYVGKLGYIRVHQGMIKRDAQLFIGDAKRAVKVSNLYRMQGGEHSDQDVAVPGDICALAKLDALSYNDVLHDSHDEDGLHLQAITTPQPMMGLHVEPENQGDEQKLSECLTRLSEEDPSLSFERDPSTQETVLRGLGDLHLRIALERAADEYGVSAKTRRPTVPYRETITSAAEGHCRHKKQTGGAGQFGEVFLRVEPLPRGSGFEFQSEVVGGSIPSQFIPAVEKGVRQVLDGGAFVGYPMEDVRVTVYDGKHHPVDSKEVAFVAAGKKAFVDAVTKAKPVVLEPMVTVDVTASGNSMGDISGDLSSHRGQISSTDTAANGQTRVIGIAPLAEMEDYANRLKAMTGGEAVFSMEFSKYEPVPAELQKKLMEAHQQNTKGAE